MGIVDILIVITLFLCKQMLIGLVLRDLNKLQH